jgi:hypothetical protein
VAFCRTSREAARTPHHRPFQQSRATPELLIASSRADQRRPYDMHRVIEKVCGSTTAFFSRSSPTGPKYSLRVAHLAGGGHRGQQPLYMAAGTLHIDAKATGGPLYPTASMLNI